MHVYKTALFLSITPQRFLGDAVFLNDGKRTWLVDTKAFLLTHRHPDDTKIQKGQLPAFALSERRPITPISPTP